MGPFLSTIKYGTIHDKYVKRRFNTIKNPMGATEAAP